MIRGQPDIGAEISRLRTDWFAASYDGRVLIHDRGHAYSYLLDHSDGTYRDWSELGLEHLREHCERFELSFENLLGDGIDPGFRICGRADTDFEVAELVNRVARCQDAIFQSAIRETS